jgi:hypothetical protein
MDVPANRYQPSARSMPDKLAEIEYASGEIVRRVSANPCVYFKDSGGACQKPFAARGSPSGPKPRTATTGFSSAAARSAKST